LFTQELIARGTCFASSVTIRPKPDQAAFAARAKWIMENIPPVIGGTFFSCQFLPYDTSPDILHNHLLVEPMPFSEGFTGDFLQYRLGVIRTYNTMIRRPRQNRIVFDPGSLVNTPVSGKTIPWKGHRQTFITADSPPENPSVCGSAASGLPGSDRDVKKLSRSQMGNLRVLTEMELSLIVKHIKKILQKYADWNMKEIPENLIPKKILEDILNIAEAEKEDRNPLIDYVKSLRQAYSRFQWHEQQKNYIQDSVTVQKG
jgi:hypothetical protein